MNLSEGGEGSTEIVEVRPARLPLGSKWQPVIGDETYVLLRTLSLSDTEKERLRDESVAILSRCIPPSAPGTRHSGLVVGNIQSGKTMSFTTVSALARDNRYQIIIVVTGTVKILFNQSVKRLANQLRLNSRRDFAWRLYRNPRPTLALVQAINEILHDWRSPTENGLEPQTILITLLKNHTQLRKASEVLERLDLRGIPALLIDDEADQAGLNTAVNQGSQSSTYRELCRLRRALPHHTYLGYTATPQAPLLINIIDMLSARFAQVLTPGVDYTGGEAFFHHEPSLIRTIPDSQIPSANNPLHGPPDSLLEALQEFFLGVATGLLQRGEDQASQNRSMLVHPSMLTASHAEFFHWIRTLKASWSRLLESDDEADREDKETLVAECRHAYDDLTATQPLSIGFEQLLGVLPQAIRRTGVYEINRRSGNPSPGIEDIDEFWRQGYSFILVGGQSLDRGFTVEGLTVTYMPRGIGVGHADTIQQRARFYGYNRRHLGLCRVYLENSARDAYQAYIEHEDDLQRRLAAHSESGRDLSEWRRMFFLDASLKPTRDNVLDIDYTRGPEPDEFYAAVPPLDFAEDLDENREIVSSFLSGFEMSPDEGDNRRTPAQRHLVAGHVSLRGALERLLVPLRIADPVDSMTFLQIRLLIERYLESHSDAICTVYRMRPAATDEYRSLGGEGRINPFQGANSPTGYPGDVRIRDANALTIQIHRLATVYQDSSRTTVVAQDVPIVAVTLPRDMASGMVVQSQGLTP